MRIINARLKIQILTPANRTWEHVTWHIAIQNSFPQRAPWSGVSTRFSTPLIRLSSRHSIHSFKSPAMLARCWQRPYCRRGVSCRDHFKDIVLALLLFRRERMEFWRWRRACRVETRTLGRRRRMCPAAVHYGHLLGAGHRVVMCRWRLGLIHSKMFALCVFVFDLTDFTDCGCSSRLPRPTQPSIPPGSVNEYTSFGWEGKGRYGSFR